MAVKKNKKTSSQQYKQRLRILKKLSFIEKGAQEIDGRKKLNANEKRRINRAWTTHSEITQTKKLEFAVKKVNKAELKVFKNLGYKTYKNKVYINKEGADRVYIAHEKINGIRELKVHKRGNQKDITDYIVPWERLHGMNEQLFKKKLKPGEYITGQFEGRSQFRHSKFKSIESFNIYIAAFQPQQPLVKSKRRTDKEQAKLKRELVSKMSIVKFKQ